MKKGIVGVSWNDVRVYHDGGLYGPTPAYTEGSLIVQHDEYVIIQNPETLLMSHEGTKNHPVEAPRFYYIPRSLIQKIEKYG
ncbi:hypothetical protein KGM48_00455 [Patescibacteria group bacterium]|nr:hypothetical protein [Patescibacteria group bacterium]